MLGDQVQLAQPIQGVLSADSALEWVQMGV
jgi:hypothetical protein